jgi:hypothetical protein
MDPNGLPIDGILLSAPAWTGRRYDILEDIDEADTSTLKPVESI